MPLKMREKMKLTARQKGRVQSAIATFAIISMFVVGLILEDDDEE